MKNFREIELLAPAKDKQTAISAINAGADAVYIGYSKFGARKQAGNSIEDIAEVIEYAHVYRAKVYVTLNTIYTDDELKEVVEVIHKLYEIGTDAVIVQDMGILNSNLPPIKIFASTQCHNNNVEKIKFLEEIGIERVILPRELSLYEIENISENSNIELEAFIHGALCVSYSGQCYFSLANGGRSANRGECAQPCRKKYSLVSKDGKIIAKNKYLLSLKDLNLSKHLKSLIQAGVSSFKIEGRLKDETYVKNVVSFYRKKLDEILKELNMEKSSKGETTYSYIPDVKKSFNRGFTDFFAEGKRKDFCTLNYVKSLGEQIGHVKSVSEKYFTLDRNTLNNGDGICFFDGNNELIGTLIQKVEGEKIYPKSINNIKKGTKIFRNLNKLFNNELLKNNAKRKILIDANLEINKNSIILTLKDEENNNVTEIYREDFTKSEDNHNSEEFVKKYIQRTGNTEFEIKNLLIKNDKNFFVPPSILNEIRRKSIQELQLVRKNNYKKDIQNKKIKPAKYPYNELDYSSNVYNSEAEDFYNKCGTKVTEKAAESLSSLDGKTLMTTKHCIKYTLGLCKKYFSDVKNFKEPLFLTDENNKKYELNFDCKNCIMLIKNQ